MAVSNIYSSRIKSAGLASGLDTEEIVKQMASLSKQRLNTQKQKLETLQWKQVEYRKAIKSISSLKDTYFNLLKPTSNLSSPSLFGARSVTSTNSLLKVTASANATEGTINLTNIIRKAESASISSSGKAIEGVLLNVNAVEGQEYKIKVNLDGLTKEISFIGGATAEDTKQNLLNSINTTFAATNAVFSFNGNRLTVSNSEMPELNHAFTISEASSTDLEGLKAIGLNDVATNKISLSMKLEDIAFQTELKGNGFVFEINGKQFTFDKSTTLSNVISTINSSNAGVKVTYDNISGKFSLQTTDSGAASSLKITQTAGNLLTAMFGDDKIAEASAISSKSLISKGIEGVRPASGEGFAFNGGDKDISDILNQSFSVTVNGVEKKIGLWGYNSSGTKNDYSKADNVVAQLNTELSREFGASAPTFAYDKTKGVFTLTGANAGDIIKIAPVDGTTDGSQKLVAALGFNSTNSTNELDIDAKMFPNVQEELTATISFGDGQTLTINQDSTLRDLIEGSFGNIELVNGSLVLKGVDYEGSDASAKTFLSSIFGETYNYPGVPATDIRPTYESQGQNAIITVDGNTITSNTNSFTINGTTIDVSALQTGATDISITTKSDTTNAMKTIKAFVEDYNKLIDELYTQISTKHDSSYPPLTEEQREEMSDKEIELWEEKAKTGLLYQDSTISRILTDLRNAINSVNSSGFSLYDIGIKPSTNYKDNGKLEIDEAKLEKALNENSEAVSKLFTDTSKGLAASVTAAINRAVATTGANKGSLIVLAGAENTSTTAENRISKQIESYKKLIETLQERYEAEQERYWKQFTALEKVMSQYNSQSSWLTAQFFSQ